MDTAKSEETRPTPTGDETKKVSTEDETRQIPIDEETRQALAGDETSQISTGEETRQIQVGDDTRQVPTGEETRQVLMGDETRQIQVGGEGLSGTMEIPVAAQSRSSSGEAESKGQASPGGERGGEGQVSSPEETKIEEQISPAGAAGSEERISAPEETKIEGGISSTEETEIKGQIAPSGEGRGEGLGSTPKVRFGKRGRVIKMAVLAVLGLAIVAGLSAWGGYQSGISQRLEVEGTMVADAARQQFQLGLEDVEAGRFEVARQRFEYVIKIDPGYPGVTELLARVLLELNTTATSTPVPTPTLTPTPDTRGEEKIEGLFLEARAFLLDRMWTEAIDTLLTLRKEAPDYQAVKVDGMLYVALRNRGVQRILNEGDLESGSYDLALAEKFGPIDVEADNYRKWAEWYSTGMSFWELDWGEASYYFGLILQVAPNLRDTSNITTTERFRIAALQHADWLAANGRYCEAEEKYQAVLNLGTNPSVEPTANWAARMCSEGEAPTEAPPPQQPPAATATATPAETTPTPTPTDQEPYPPPSP